MKDTRNWRYRSKPRVRLVTPTSSGGALIAHIRHLQSGWAYDSRCRYCQLDIATPSGVNKDTIGSIVWYKQARISGRNEIPLDEYVESEPPKSQQ